MTMPSAEDSRKIRFVSFLTTDLFADKNLPGDIYICVQYRMLKYLKKGDVLTRAKFDQLVQRNVPYVFIDFNEIKTFDSWRETCDAKDETEMEAPNNPPESQSIIQATKEQRRSAMDLFANIKDDKQVIQTVEISKRLAAEFLKKPFAMVSFQALNRHSKGCADHSVNVSVLSVFLGIRMGYSTQIILENLALGGLFHDIGQLFLAPGAHEEQGKPAATGATGALGTGATASVLSSVNDFLNTLEQDYDISGSDKKSTGALPANSKLDRLSYKNHPLLGREYLENNKIPVSQEVKMIVAQHHEFMDGSGYPKRLKGLAIYDLAKIVTIANEFDNLISFSKQNTLKEKIKESIDRLEYEYTEKLEQKKVKKAVNILRYGFL